MTNDVSVLTAPPTDLEALAASSTTLMYTAPVAVDAVPMAQSRDGSSSGSGASGVHGSGAVGAGAPSGSGAAPVTGSVSGSVSGAGSVSGSVTGDALGSSARKVQVTAAEHAPPSVTDPDRNRLVVSVELDDATQEVAIKVGDDVDAIAATFARQHGVRDVGTDGRGVAWCGVCLSCGVRKRAAVGTRVMWRWR